MTSISQVSSYSRYMNTVRTLNTTQSNVDDLTRQLTSNKKSTDLTAFGSDTQKLLDLRSELVQRTNYVTNIDTASSRVAAYDTVLTALEKLTTTWQSATTMPSQAGAPTVDAPTNGNADAMSFKVNLDKSKFQQSSNVTVTSVPASPPAANGTFNVTISDGLGGTTTRAINLTSVPPDDGKGYNFTLNGGPGSGTLINLSFDTLTASSTSNFKVSYQQAKDVQTRIEGAMTDVQQYLNQRYGDRYLFAGTRYSQEPVSDLKATQQSSRVTFNGDYVKDQDYYEVKINDQVFGMRVNGSTLQFTNNDGSSPAPINLGSTANLTTSNIAHAFQTCINAYANPAVPVSIAAVHGVLAITAQNTGTTFDVSARVQNATTYDNSVTSPTTTQAASITQPQIDSFTLQGNGVDIGDTFKMSIVVGDPNDPYNQVYYRNHPSEPQDLPVYQKYDLAYTVTAADLQSGTPFNVTNVASQMVGQFNNMNPKPAVSLSATGATLSVTSNTNLPSVAGVATHPGMPTLFTTSASVVNCVPTNTVSVATLPPESTALTDQINTAPPTLPYYDTSYPAKKTDDAAWTKVDVAVDDGYNVQYGLTSVDPAFQTMIKAMRMVRIAATNPGQYDTYVNQARDLMAQAQSQLRSVHAKVSSDAATLSTQKDLQQNRINSVTDRVADIEGIDQTEVAARLRTAMNAQEAAYTVIGQTQKLSLLNYIA